MSRPLPGSLLGFLADVPDPRSRHEPSSSFRITTRTTPPAGRQVAWNVLTRTVTA
jgi:hypothetical protein